MRKRSMSMPAQPSKTLNQLRELKRKWDKLTEGWFGNIIYIIIGFAVALAINEGLKPLLHTDTPVVAVFSESMIPNLQKGDLVIVQGANFYTVGDVVVYESPVYRYPIIHRIIEVTDQGVVTKGDNNMAADPWITPQSLIHGKAAVRIPLLGWVKVLAYEFSGLA